MSRSWKKAYYKDGYGTGHKRFAKQRANRSVRRSADIVDGGYYKKLHCSWNISDYKSDCRYYDYVAAAKRYKWASDYMYKKLVDKKYRGRVGNKWYK